jgi:uncharacterized protein YfbU (UPF0304 family)
MKLTDTERLILANQYEILALLDEQQSYSHKRSADALLSGYEYEYDQLDQRLSRGGDVLPDEECKFVWRVLGMYDDLQRVAATADSGIDPKDVVFMGFDGNNETKYMGYAQYIRRDKYRFQVLAVMGEDLNSHMHSLMMYARMLQVRDRAANPHQITVAEAKAILVAKRAA